MRLTAFKILVALSMLCVSTRPGFCGAKMKPESDDQLLFKVISEGYLSNREAFGFLTCRFDVTIGKAASIGDAVEGRLFDRATSQNIWIANGQKTRFETACDPELLEKEVKAQAGRRTGIATFMPQKYLDSGSMQLNYSPFVGVACVNGPISPSRGIELTPFDMGVMGQNERFSPGRILAMDWKKKGLFLSCEAQKMIASRSLTVISLRKTEKDWFYKFFFDTGRGFLPIQHWERKSDGSGLEFKLFITSVKECAGSRWFPTRSVLIWDPDNSTKPLRVREIVVRELDAEKPPQDSEFAIELRKGTFINDGVKAKTQFALEKTEMIALTDLSSALSHF